MGTVGTDEPQKTFFTGNHILDDPDCVTLDFATFEIEKRDDGCRSRDSYKDLLLCVDHDDEPTLFFGSQYYIRIRRAESWLRRSKAAEANRRQAVSDEDVAALDCEQFIFLWISFNAAYGRELLDDERDDDNPTESQKFNEFLAKILERDSNQAIKTILWETYSDAVLREVFDRLYILRNQLFHGGATFSTGWGRSQVRDGSRIMASLVPEILKIMQTDMEKNPGADTWGAVAFPRVNEGPDEGIR